MRLSIATLILGFFCWLYTGCSNDSSTFIDNGAKKALNIEPADLELTENEQYPLAAFMVDDTGQTTDVTNTALWSSSDTDIATINASGTVTGVGVGSCTITATNAGKNAHAEVSVFSNDWQTLQILPSSVTLNKGLDKQLHAFALYTNGDSVEVTKNCLWESANSTIVSVQTTEATQGKILGVTTGSTTVSARFQGRSGSIPVTVTDAHLTNIDVLPESATVAMGFTQAFKVLAYYSDNSTNDITSLATWKNEEPTIASLSNEPDKKGQATGITEGTTTISAEFKGFKHSSTLHVTDAKVVRIDIFPKTIALQTNTEMLATADALLSDNSSTNITRDAIWSVKDDTIATVIASGNDAGDITGVKAGTTELQASFQGFHDTASIKVTDPHLVSLSVESERVVYPIESEINYRALAKFSDASHQDVTTEAHWSSDNNAVIEIIPTGTDAGKAKALKAGTANITAKYQSLNATTQTKVSKATLTGIMIEPANLTRVIDLKQAYQAIGIYSDTSKKTITEQVNWRIDDGASAVASIDEKGIATTVAPGNATVFADLEGIEGSTPLTVIDEALVSIYIEPPQNPYYIKGLTDQLTAYGTYSSTHGNINTYNVTDKVEWSSNKTQVIAINNIDQKGFIQAVDTGHATVSIFLQGKEDHITLFVKAPTLEKIELQPVDSTIQTHENLRFTARGTYSDHNSTDISRFVTWESIKPETARIDEYGLVTPESAGKTEIAAIDPVTKVKGSTGLTVKASGISKLKVLPNKLSMGVGVSKPLLAKATFLDGTEKDVTALASWESLKPSVASVNNTTDAGIVTGHEVGEASITAGFEDLQSSAAIEVIKHELDHILVEPEDAHVPQGVYTQYKATAVYTDKFEEDVSHDTNWSVSASPIATINSKGLVLGETAGKTHIIANFQGKQQSTQLTVTDLILQRLVIIPSSSDLSFVIGDTQHLVAEGVFGSNQVIDMTRSVVWVSNKPDVLSVVASGPQAGLATAHTKGSATITVYSQHANKTASMTYTVNVSVLNSISIAPVNPVIPENNTVNFTATGSYADGVDRDITADCFWESKHPAIAPITQLGIAQTLTTGETNITASYKKKSALSLLTVVAGDAVKAITITPSPATMSPYSGSSFNAEATFYNGSTLDITRAGTWASSNTSVASIFNTIWIQGKVWAWGPTGDTEISITYKGVTAKTLLTVK